MTTIDLHHSPVRHYSGSSIASTVTAVLLVLLLGVAALVAPESEVAPETWRGNSASSVSLR